MAALFFGVAILVFSFQCFRIYIKQNRRKHEIVTGKVISFERHQRHSRNMGNVKGFTMFYEFYYNGQTYRDNHNINISKYTRDLTIEPYIEHSKNIHIVPRSKYKIGDSVDVRIYDGDPKTSIIDDKKALVAPLITGIVTLLVGVAILAVYFL